MKTLKAFFLDIIKVISKPSNIQPVHSKLKGLVKKHFSASKRILEVGCSEGQTALHDTSNYVGLDLGKHFLRKFQSADPNHPNLIQANALQLPITSNSFDGIYCFGTFTLLKEAGVRKSLSEMKRIAKDDGKFLFQFMNPYSIQYQTTAKQHWQKDKSFSYHPLSNSKVKEILRSEGFEIIKSHHYLWIPYYLVCKLNWNWLTLLDIFLGNTLPFFSCKNVYLCRKANRPE